jgi:hypothetical protein
VAALGQHDIEVPVAIDVAEAYAGGRGTIGLKQEDAIEGAPRGGGLRKNREGAEPDRQRQQSAGKLGMSRHAAY